MPEDGFTEVIDDLTIRSRVTRVLSASKKVRGRYTERLLLPRGGAAESIGRINALCRVRQNFHNRLICENRGRSLRDSMQGSNGSNGMSGSNGPDGSPGEVTVRPAE